LRSPDVVKLHIAEWLAGFPDLHFDVEQVIAEATLVVSQVIVRGTHTGAWLGLAPTGRQISIRMMVIQRIANGKIVEDWVLVETLGLFQQLGLVPATQEILAQAAK
jgi:predicted ester cyclase